MGNLIPQVPDEDSQAAVGDGINGGQAEDLDSRCRIIYSRALKRILFLSFHPSAYIQKQRCFSRRAKMKESLSLIKCYLHRIRYRQGIF